MDIDEFIYLILSLHQKPLLFYSEGTECSNIEYSCAYTVDMQYTAYEGIILQTLLVLKNILVERNCFIHNVKISVTVYEWLVSNI